MAPSLAQRLLVFGVPCSMKLSSGGKLFPLSGDGLILT